MCGIAGKVSWRGAVDRGLIERMCRAEAHRGPDSRGLHLTDGVGLGVQRLRVIDLETGDQPIYNEDRSIAVVFNGEIYNYRELRSGLERRGHGFRTEADTEVIPHLYEECGPDLVTELDGMFAFALYDERRRLLLLARDRVGKKPLYYFVGDGFLSFASELGALMVDPDIPREIDPIALDAYLGYGYVPAPWSIWSGVRKLEPAHALCWGRGGVRTDRYWRLDYSRKLDAHPRELEEEARRLIGAAVRRRMVADVPLGALLSGGVDSSIVVAEMAAASSQPVRTFSIGFEEQRYNELPEARLIAERFATDHHEFVVRPDAIEILPRLARHYGEPFADESAIPSFYLAELARRHVTVALNGDGGDESFAGYPRYVANALTAPIDHVPVGLRRALAAAGRLFPDRVGVRDPLSRARRLLVSMPDDAIGRYIRHVSIFTPRERQALLVSDLAREVDPGRARSVVARPWEEASGPSRLDVLMEVDIATYLPGDLLVKMDIAAMAHSLETRSPLLDFELMEFAAALPPRWKAALGRKKRLLRRAYRGRVPDHNLDGPKRGFGVPLGTWFRGDLHDYARDILLAPDAFSRELIRPARVEEMLAAHRTGTADRAMQIWSLLVLEEWQRVVSQPAPSPATTAS